MDPPHSGHRLAEVPCLGGERTFSVSVRIAKMKLKLRLKQRKLYSMARE